VASLEIKFADDPESNNAFIQIPLTFTVSLISPVALRALQLLGAVLKKTYPSRIRWLF
jgi:hypothetical protein